MALSGNQITRNAPGGAGRGYAGFTAKVALPVAISEEVTGGWWARPARRRASAVDPIAIAPKRVRRIIRQTVTAAAERDLAVLREQTRNAIAARHVWDDAYNALIDRAIQDIGQQAAQVGPAASAMRLTEARRRNDEEAIAVMMMTLF